MHRSVHIFTIVIENRFQDLDEKEKHIFSKLKSITEHLVRVSSCTFCVVKLKINHCLIHSCIAYILNTTFIAADTLLLSIKKEKFIPITRNVFVIY